MNSFGVVDSPLKRNVIRKQSRKKITKPQTTHRQGDYSFEKSSLRLSSWAVQNPRHHARWNVSHVSMRYFTHVHLGNSLYAILGNGSGVDNVLASEQANQIASLPEQRCNPAGSFIFFFFTPHPPASPSSQDDHNQTNWNGNRLDVLKIIHGDFRLKNVKIKLPWDV